MLGISTTASSKMMYAIRTHSASLSLFTYKRDIGEWEQKQKKRNKKDPADESSSL